jgi:S-adenosylmethionine hydrolase
MVAVITLTTDFGPGDAYVAAMKGVILGINPAAVLIDISQAVAPQDIRQAAFILGTAFPFFPPRTIHLAVVDPGVGTGRKAIILRTPHADFVAPDNGILTFALQDAGGAPSDNGHVNLAPGSGLEAVAIAEPRFQRSPVSATFHGRDIFAPAAAHLSLGVPLADIGEPVDSLVAFPVPVPRRTPEGGLIGSILHIDGFGNLITNIKAGDLPGNTAPVAVTVGGETITGLSRTYGDAEGLLALIGSSDRLEIALKNGNAAACLQARIGDVVQVRTQIK